MSNMDTTPTGTCTKCGERCTYAATNYGHYWVHARTGSFMSGEPERHDCNTYIEKESS